LTLNPHQLQELQRGVAQFNHGRFFISHETIEEIWIGQQGQTRIFLQALIQLAAAYHHAEKGNLRGTLSLLPKCLQVIEKVPRIYLGLDCERLGLDLRWAVSNLQDRQGAQKAPPRIKILLVQDKHRP